MPKKQGTDGQLLTIHELAVYSSISTSLRSASSLPREKSRRCRSIAEEWRFKRAAIDQWIQDQLVGEDETFDAVPDGMQLPLDDLLPDQSLIITNLRANSPIGVIHDELAARAVHERLADRQAVVRGRGGRARVAVVDRDGRWRRVPAHACEGQGQDRAPVHHRGSIVGRHLCSVPPMADRRICSSCSASSTTACTCRSSAGSHARCGTSRRSRSCDRCSRPIRCARSCSRKMQTCDRASCPRSSRRRSSRSSIGRCGYARSAGSETQKSKPPEPEPKSKRGKAKAKAAAAKAKPARP